MDLRHLRHFVAVAEELHFGRAAERLNMAQPPLSQSIKRLEMNLGVLLFERSRHGVALTRTGQAFLGEARRTLMQANLARTVAQRTEAGELARINVGFIGPALHRIVPAVLLEHKKLYPDVDVRLFEMSSPQQMQAIMEGKLDIGFVLSSVDLITGGDSFIVERSTLLLATPVGSPLAKRSSIRLTDLTDENLILPPASTSPTRVAEILAAFRSAGFLPKLGQEAMQTSTMLSLVAVGIGSALVPATARLEGRANVAFVPVEDLPSNLRWDLAVVWWPTQLSRSAKSFLELTKKVVRDNPAFVGEGL